MSVSIMPLKETRKARVSSAVYKCKVYHLYGCRDDDDDDRSIYINIYKYK